MVKSVWKSVLAGTAAAVALTACGQDQGGNPGGASESASPKEVYTSNCASCHGEQLEGNVGPGLNKIGGKYSEKEIAAIIQQGKGQMPAQNQVAPTDREKLAGWLSEKK